MGVLARFRGSGDDPAGLEAQRRAPRLPVYRSGTVLETAEVAWGGEGVSRELALGLATLYDCRNLVTGTLVQLHPYRYRGQERLDPDWLLTRPDPSTTWASTLCSTVDDLIFYGRAYWRVLERDPEGYARRARWTPFLDVTPQTRSSGGAYGELLGYRVAGIRDELAVDDLIRFDGIRPGILDYCATPIATAIELELAARRFASVELPAGVLHNEGTELGEDEAARLVEGFQAARRERTVAFLQGVTYSREAIMPADLELLAGRAQSATDMARLFSIPVSMVAASPSGNASSMVYANLTQQLALLLATAIAPHRVVIEQTLTDATPRGQAVALDTQTFLRSDPTALSDYVIALLDAGLVDRAEARSMLGMPATTAAAEPDLTPGRV